MVDKLTFQSAANAVRNAYYKTATASAALLTSGTALLYSAYRLQKYYLQIWQNDLDSFTLLKELSVAVPFVAGGIMDVFAVIGAPVAFWYIHSNSKSVTAIDKEQRRIYKTRTGAFELSDVSEYDAITSVAVHQGPLETRANTGSVSINTLRLVGKGHWSDVQQDKVLLPYQNNPFEVRNKILEGLPTNEDLVARLRGN